MIDIVGKQPWKHQLEALRRAQDLDEFALFLEPGVGKTLCSILICREKMLRSRRALRTLVLSPPVVLKNWQNEWLENTRVRDTDIFILSGPGQKRAAALAGSSPLVVVTNYESLLMPAVFSALKTWHPEILIADESHRCKNPSAKRTKRCIELSKLTRYRLILTGTPVLNSPMDLYSQFLILDHGKTFGTNFMVFRHEFFYDKNAGMPPQRHFPDWRIRPGALERISKMMIERSMHVKKADCLDLPPLVRKTISVELSAEQKRLYREMAQDFITYLEGRACVAKLALTKALRLMQVISGFVALEGEDGDERTVRELKDNPRREALRELLADLTESGKVLVWASFKQNYEQIRKVCESLKIKYVEIHGEIPTAEKHKAVETFNTDETVRVLIGHPGSGGIGINLCAANAMIFYSRTWSLEHDSQAEARNHRGGSEIHDKITRYDLVAEGTIDELVLKRLADKQGVSDSLVKDLAVELKREDIGRNRRVDKGLGRERDQDFGT